MTFQAIIDNLVSDTFLVSVPLYGPEVALGTTVVLLILTRLLFKINHIDSFWFALIGTVAALVLSAPVEGWPALGNIPRTELFTGMLVYDGLTSYMRLLLLVCALLFIVLAKLTQVASRVRGPEFYVLMLGATLGMCIMSSANHLMTLFLGVEMASVPSYVLVGLLQRRRLASEAALKYAVFGAGASGIMLYGVSLLAGLLGTAHLPTMAIQLARLDLPGMMAQSHETGTIAALVLGGLLTAVGLAFKLSAVPFHFWCPDAFEGATAEVAGFLSIASKAAALALLLRVVFVFGGVPSTAEMVAETPPAVPAKVVAVSLAPAIAMSDVSLAPVRSFLTVLIAALAAVTCTFGNFAALGQTNMKRLLAYSTIAHAGYMMMPIAAMASLAGTSAVSAGEAVSSILIYVTIYLFMNLAAFAIVAFLRDGLGSEEIADYAGLVHAAPILTGCMVIAMASLVGLPPFAGFLGKFAALVVLAKAGTPLMLSLLVIAGVNTVVSLVYYWSVVRTMCLRPEPASRKPLVLAPWPVVYTFLVTLPLLLLILFPKGLTELAQAASRTWP